MSNSPSSAKAAASDDWRVGSKLRHPFNPELGVGWVRRIDGRFLVVWFPRSEREVTLAAEGAGLTRLVLGPAARARLVETDEEVEIAGADGHRYRLRDGREVDDAALWPLEVSDTPVERLARLELDSADGFRNRIEGLRLMRLRESGGLGSFLGGRIELFAHQLHAAETAFGRDPVRWLLADEVGLGKTVEACLILSAMVRTGRAERALVVAPSTLAIQWLGELYRKFHQVFVMMDHERVDAVASTLGEDVNPFEVHPLAVAPLEWLASDPELLRLASEAVPDVIVLDEAHRLAKPEWTEALGPLVRASEHAILLTATPLQSDRRGFYQLFDLLQPAAFDDFESFDAAVERGDAVLPCTSAVRRVDVGGLPPRVPLPVDLGPATGELENDPRVRWLVEQVPRWSAAGEKALVFVSDVERLQALSDWLEARTRTRMAVFHEHLSPAKRDIEVASFRESHLPVLLCSEAGGEGRNFQFCHRMVHFDLPLDPVELEQRIGRLDRIGRQWPVEIVYFRCEGERPDLPHLYERLGLFERPAAGLDAALAPVRPAVEAAVAAERELDVEALVSAVEREREDAARHLVRVFYPDAYTPERAPEILARVPAALETLTHRFCVGAAEQLGFDVVEKSEHSLYYIELGAASRVDNLPDVEGGSRFLGTFDREEALDKEEADFFASGHPLVEGLLLELEDGPRGRATLLEMPGAAVAGAGLACVYKDGPEFSVVLVAADGTPRPEWVEPFLEALPAARGARPEKWGLSHGWADGIRQLGSRAEGRGELVAAAFFRPGG